MTVAQQPVPARIEDLSFAEQLVLWAVRHRAARRNAESVRRELDLATGQGTAALGALDAILLILGSEGRRTFMLHRLCCAGISRDELSLLTLVAAIQSDDRGYAEGLLLWLLPRAAARLASAHASRLASLLAEGGHRLPCRRAARMPELATEPMRATLH